MGFRRGETFGMLLPNIPEYPVTLLGASGIGMPVALINPSYTAGTNRLIVFLKRKNVTVLGFTEEIAQLCHKSQVKVIVGVSAMAETLRRVNRLCPSVRRLILIGGSEEGFVSIGDMLADPGDLFNENIDVKIV